MKRKVGHFTHRIRMGDFLYKQCLKVQEEMRSGKEEEMRRESMLHLLTQCHINEWLDFLIKKHFLDLIIRLQRFLLSLIKISIQPLIMILLKKMFLIHLLIEWIDRDFHHKTLTMNNYKTQTLSNSREGNQENTLLQMEIHTKMH